MSTFRFILICTFFTVSYICVLLLLFYVIPEDVLWNIATSYYDGFIHEPVWDDIFTSLLLILSLIINAIFIYIVMFFRNKNKREKNLDKRIS